jgi:hypothetical protein
MKHKLNDYTVEFDSVFRVPDARALFMRYLMQQKNDNGFSFLLDVRSLGDAANEKEVVSKVLQIVDSYIKLGGVKEINIDVMMRMPILHKIERTKQYDNRTKLVVPLDIFATAAAMIHRELRDDAFIKFIRSHEFTTIVDTREGFLGEVTHRRKKRSTWHMDTQRFHDTVITDGDISNIVKVIADSYEWELHRRNKEGNFVFMKKIMVNSNEVYIGKSTGHVQCSAEQALISFTDFDQYKTFDMKNHIPTNTIGNTYAQLTGIYEIPMSFPLKNRASLCTSTLVYDKDQRCYIWLCKSILPQDDVPKKATMECWVITQFFQISETSCRYVHSIIADFHVPLATKKFFRGFYTKLFAEFHDILGKLCIHTPNKPNNNAKVLDTLDDFTTRFPQGKSWC